MKWNIIKQGDDSISFRQIFYRNIMHNGGKDKGSEAEWYKAEGCELLMVTMNSDKLLAELSLTCYF